MSISYREIFWVFFKINALTFGGGYTIAPVIMDEFCTKRHLISDDDMLDIIALAQSVPGALAVAVSILTGYKIKGRKGALLAMVASILPPLIVVSLIYYCYDALQDNHWIRAALRGMSGVIAAILFASVYRLGIAAVKQHPLFSTGLLLITFIIAQFTAVSTAVIILSLALLGLITFSVLPSEVVK